MKVMYSNMVYYIVDSKTFVQIMNLDVNFCCLMQVSAFMDLKWNWTSVRKFESLIPI